jgi:hypothetical protein
VIAERALSGEHVRFVNDQIGTVTVASDLARALATLVRERPGGLWHVANTGTTTWFDVAGSPGESSGATMTSPRRSRPPTSIRRRSRRGPIAKRPRHREVVGAGWLALPAWQRRRRAPARRAARERSSNRERGLDRRRRAWSWTTTPGGPGRLHRLAARQRRHRHRGRRERTGRLDAARTRATHVVLVEPRQNLGYGRGVNRGAAATGPPSTCWSPIPTSCCMTGPSRPWSTSWTNIPTSPSSAPRSCGPTVRSTPRTGSSRTSGWPGLHALLESPWPDNPATRIYRSPRPDGSVDWVSGACFLAPRRLRRGRRLRRALLHVRRGHGAVLAGARARLRRRGRRRGGGHAHRGPVARSGPRA